MRREALGTHCVLGTIGISPVVLTQRSLAEPCQACGLDKAPDCVVLGIQAKFQWYLAHNASPGPHGASTQHVPVYLVNPAQLFYMDARGKIPGMLSRESPGAPRARGPNNAIRLLGE